MKARKEVDEKEVKEKEEEKKRKKECLKSVCSEVCMEAGVLKIFVHNV